jgi:hypothetical protein
MKRFLLFGSLAMAAASLVTADAAAQDTIRRPGALARSPSYSSLLSALAATATATQKVTSRSVTAADIRVVDAVNVIGSDNEEPVRAALESHRDHVAALRAAVGSNMAYTAALAAHKDKPTASDVIAVDILDSGDVLVYFRKAS